MKRLKDCYYLCALLAAGAVYLGAADGWKIYAQAFGQVRDFWQGDGAQEGGKAVQDGQSAEPDTEPGDKGPADGEGSRNPAGPGGESTTAENEAGGTAGTGDDGMAAPGTGYPGQGQASPGSEGGTGEYTPAEDPAGSWEPVFGTVEDDYFSDAVFIGDSRTVGMYEYGGLEDISTFYASSGLTVYKLFDAAIVAVPGEKKKITVEEALQAESFAKIYLMIGINEMGTGTVESFTEKYREAVQHLRELQPDAVIYIQGIIKVTAERSGQGDYINNEGIEARNAELEKLADNRDIFYLDVNPLICDETGGLIDSYTFDGVHLKAKYIYIWKDYLKGNAVTNLPGAG